MSSNAINNARFPEALGSSGNTGRNLASQIRVADESFGSRRREAEELSFARANDYKIAIFGFRVALEVAVVEHRADCEHFTTATGRAWHSLRCP